MHTSIDKQNEWARINAIWLYMKGSPGGLGLRRKQVTLPQTLEQSPRITATLMEQIPYSTVQCRCSLGVTQGSSKIAGGEVPDLGNK